MVHFYSAKEALTDVFCKGLKASERWYCLAGGSSTIRTREQLSWHYMRLHKLQRCMDDFARSRVVIEYVEAMMAC